MAASESSHRGRKRQAEATSGLSTPTSLPAKTSKRRMTARISSSKVSELEPTWEDTPKPILIHGSPRTQDDHWMAAYMGLKNKYELRHLSILPLVVKISLEVHDCKFTPKEIGEALRRLADQDIAAAASDNDSEDDNDDPSPSEVVKESEGPEDENEPYIDRSNMDAALRIEFLSRALLTISRALELLTSDHGAVDVSEDARNTAEVIVRGVSKMDSFILPQLDPKYLRAPCLGPNTYKGRKEHAVEKYTRVLSLLLFTKNNLGTQSKYFQAGCIGGYLPRGENAKTALSAEEFAELIARGARKWLGQNLAFENERVASVDGPEWMQEDDNECFPEEPLDVEPHRPGRRPIEFQAIWLPDYPGESRFETKCEDAWSDEARKEELRIPGHISEPVFAKRKKRVAVPDPRNYDDYPTWRDSLRRELGFTIWKFNFQTLWHIDQRLSLTDATSDLLDGEDVAKGQCREIFCDTGEEPESWPYFLKAVEKGGDTQTLFFICEPLFGEKFRHYPWETVAFLFDPVPHSDEGNPPKDENAAAVLKGGFLSSPPPQDYR